MANYGDVDPTKLDLDISDRENPLVSRIWGRTSHGNHRIDVPVISHIEGNLWQGGCRDGLILPEFIKHHVSLYPWEKYTVNHHLDSRMSVTMYDAVDQTTDQVEAIALWVSTCMKTGPVLVNCQAGLNRSGLVAAAALIINGHTPMEAIDLIRESRGPGALCNPTFEKWVLEWDGTVG